MKRKLFINVLALCLLISLLPAMRMSASAAETWTHPSSDSPPAEFTLGVDGTTTNAGTESNPYAISSAQDMVNFRYLVNHGSDYSGKYLALTADIVFIDDVLAADGSINIGKSIDRAVLLARIIVLKVILMAKVIPSVAYTSTLLLITEDCSAKLRTPQLKI